MTANTGKRTTTKRSASVVTPIRKAPAKATAPRKRVAKPKHGPNRTAAEATIGALRALGRLEAIDSARIAALQKLADAVDMMPANPGLWAQYRAAESALREVRDDADDFGDLLKRLSPEVVDK